MANVHEGTHVADKKKVSIVTGRFNDVVTTRLVNSAVDCLLRHGADPDEIQVYWVPGSFEVPQMAMRIAEQGHVDGIICLGAIIRGETNHFDVLSASVINSVADVSSRCSLPVTYGIVTAENLDQAMDRAGGKRGNKGWECALALIEMMTLWEN